MNVRSKVNHPLHAMLTLITCGAWGIVWLILAAFDKGQVPSYTVMPSPVFSKAGWYQTATGWRYFDGYRWYL